MSGERGGAGKPAAETVEWEKYRPLVRSVVARMVRAPEDVEELVQDVLVAAVRCYDKFEGHCEISTWLHQISVNRVLNHLTKTQREWQRAMSRDVDLMDAVGELVEPGIGPEKAVVNAELGEVVRAALRRMPETCRAAVWLRDVEGLSYRQIGERLGVTEEAVKSRIWRGRRWVQGRVAEYVGNPSQPFKNPLECGGNRLVVRIRGWFRGV